MLRDKHPEAWPLVYLMGQLKWIIWVSEAADGPGRPPTPENKNEGAITTLDPPLAPSDASTNHPHPQHTGSALMSVDPDLTVSDVTGDGDLEHGTLRIGNGWNVHGLLLPRDASAQHCMKKQLVLAAASPDDPICFPILIKDGQGFAI